MKLGSHHTPESRALLAAANLGNVVSEATKARISASSRGELGNSWRGDDVGITGAHRRHQRTLAGQPCARADATCAGRLECAFNHDTPAEYVKQSPVGPYSPRVEDYMRLCHSHHVRYDSTRKTHCKYGHEFTPENTRRTKDGKRQCRICDRRRSERAS